MTERYDALLEEISQFRFTIKQLRTSLEAKNKIVDELVEVLEKIKVYEENLSQKGIGYDGHIFGTVTAALKKAKVDRSNQ